MTGRPKYEPPLLAVAIPALAASHQTPPWGPGHETIALDADGGMINIDVVADQIVCVEVLNREDIRTALLAVLP